MGDYILVTVLFVISNNALMALVIFYLASKWGAEQQRNKYQAEQRRDMGFGQAQRV